MRNTPTLPQAAYATHAAPNVSSKYVFLPTGPLLEALDGEFEVYSASQKRTRKAGMEAFAAHEIVLRPRGLELALGEIFPQVILKNAHNGGGALGFRVSAEIPWCLNGASRAAQDIGDIRIRHSGKADTGTIIDGTCRVLEKSTEWAHTLTGWQAIPLSLPDRLELAERALELRYPKHDAPIEPPLALTVRFKEDYELRETLFGAFNAIQGNLNQHGLPLKGKKGRSIRAKTGDSFHAFNEELALLAEEYAAKA
jgi:hypothetical protein